MRLDHLLSKEEKRSRGYFTVELSGRKPEAGKGVEGRQEDNEEDAGGDALMGNTRTHPEHDG